MSLLTAYLSTPRAQKALTKKPGDKGFSLIELVVVVAVLAILSAIAIPNFTNISAQAAHSASKTTLATIAKECATKFASNETGAQYATISGGNGVYYNSTEASSTTRLCGTGAAPNIVCAFVNAGTAASYCVGADGSKPVGALADIENAGGTGLRTVATGASWLGAPTNAEAGSAPNATAW
jgi:type IV pilus assembly protein PilA